MAKLDDAIAKLVSAPSFGILTSCGASGWPHSTVMWLDVAPEHLLINTRLTRRHYTNLLAEPRCTVVILDSKTPYHYAVVQATLSGTVVGEEAGAHVHMLSQRYRSKPYHTDAPSDRVILCLAPESQRECWSVRGRKEAADE